MNPFRLVQAVSDGDPRAEAYLVRAFTSRIRFLASRRVPSSLVDDVVQETLAAVIRALRQDRLRDERNLQAFVYGTARNVISNILRDESRWRMMDSIELVGEPESDGPDPLLVLVEVERHEVIRDCLGELHEQDRHILYLAFYEGHPPREIARILQITPKVARLRKWRALKRFEQVYRARRAVAGGN